MESTDNFNASNWYSTQLKPSFSPPSYLFGIVWSILYPIIFATFGFTIYKVIKKEIPPIVLVPLGINLISNLAFSPIQFGLQNNLLAAIDITIVLGSLIWFIILIFNHNKIIGYAQIPYLLWVAFATILQYSVTWLNR